MAYLWRLFQTGTLNSPPKSGNISALGQPEFWILSADQRPNWEAQSRARIGHRLHYNSKPSHLVLTVPTGRVHIQFTYLGTYSGGPTPHRRLAAPLCGSPLNTHSQIWTWTLCRPSDSPPSSWLVDGRLAYTGLFLPILCSVFQAELRFMNLSSHF